MYFISQEQCQIDIHANDEYAFRWSCMNGHLIVAKWLYSLKQHSINIHINEECAFRWSCIKGHLDVAQWLYSIGHVNIHARNRSVFKCAHKDILIWLNNLP